MSQGVYAALTRQVGLMREMDIVANNIANAATTGFRSEAMIFSEFVRDIGGGASSLSMAAGHGHLTHMSPGTLEATGGTFDFAIEGEGFFQIAAPDGLRITRAGAFSLNPFGELVTFDGHQVLDAGGVPVFVPPDARDIHLASDGTLSADGRPVSQLGLFAPADPTDLQRADGVSFTSASGFQPVDNPRIVQGFLESSNVEPVTEIARMIAVQNAYEMGQSFLQREDERMRAISRLLES